METALPTLFFLNGKLHKKLKIIKSENLVVAFCYPDEEHKHYVYSVVLKDFKKAYSLSQVAKLVRRPQVEIFKFLKQKLIDKPSGFEYYISSRKPKQMHWSQQEVLDLRDRLYELAPKGPDGFPSGRYILASKSELLHEINGDISYYVKDQEGGFRKVWRAI